MFLQLEQPDLLAQLRKERNTENITLFATDYAIRFLILQKTKEEVKVEIEWLPEMLSSTNILMIKKNNFNIHKDITTFKIAEMLQVSCLINRLLT
jgi:hypothetical protein